MSDKGRCNLAASSDLHFAIPLAPLSSDTTTNTSLYSATHLQSFNISDEDSGISMCLQWDVI